MTAETHQRTLWVDCEFTGLSLKDDLLLEIGAVATSGLFREIGSYQTFVSQDPESVMARMAQDDWWPSRPQHKSEMLAQVSRSKKSLAEIDAELVAFAGQHFTDPIILAGNSMGVDRQYIARDLPEFNKLLHYRSIDVTSFKEVARHLGIEEYEKTAEHRVMGDIHESMDELRYLLERIGNQAIQALIKE
jgi:oligoribonuclease